MFVFQKIWYALLSCYLRFEICLLPYYRQLLPVSLWQATFDQFYFICVNYRNDTMAHMDSLKISRKGSRTTSAVLLAFADFRQAHPFHVVVQTWSMPTIYIFSSEHILAQSSNKDLRIMYLTLFLVPHYCLWNSDLSLDVFTFEYSPLYKLAQPMFSVKIPAIFFLQLP